MRKNAAALMAVCMLLAALMAATADVIFYDDMLGMAEYTWDAVYVQPGAMYGWSNISASVAEFAVLNDGYTVAYSPTSYLDFVSSATWDQRKLGFDIPQISAGGNLEYDVGFDMFDASYVYLAATVVHGDDGFVGTTNYSLSGIGWDAATVYVRPKLTVTANGAANQSVFMDSITIERVIPEPSTALLMGLGLAGCFSMLGNRRRRRT